MKLKELEKYEQYFDDEVLFRRAKHCVTEEERVKSAVQVLKKGNIKAFGQLLMEANISMRDDYEATGKELDTVFEIAIQIDGVAGSRMTGGGFGGCNISIVKSDMVDEFMQIIKEKYKEKIGYEPSFYLSKAGKGAGEVYLD